MNPPDFDLGRFIAAQRAIFDQALAELERGRKESHWMWFVFPQLVGLGHSATAQRYAIQSLAEARAYLEHAILGQRLLETTQVVLEHAGRRSAEAIFGPVDALKLRSSMTLFEVVADDPTPFAQAIELFFGGERDPLTLQLIGA